jgi:hypothetical protein
MKTFKEYLTESKKVYDFRIKVAGELPESFQENLKTSLGRCGVSKLEKVATTPIQANPLDFPNHPNTEVHIFEVICDYPVTAPEIVTDIRALGLDEACFKVRGQGEDSEAPLVEPTETSFLADAEYKDVKIKHKDYFGDDFNKSFLKDLDKAAKARKKDNEQGEYKLPKGKTDKAGTKSALGS